MTSTLQLDLLGTSSIRLDGVPLQGLRYGKAEALLYYLAVTGRPHSRESLAALLWSDVPEEAARTNLRTVLSKLRAHLAPHLLITRRALAFDRTSPYELDVERFLACVHDTAEEPYVRLKRAAELFRGDVLEGFFVQGAPMFDEWLAGQRDWVRGLVIQALHGLAAHHAERSEYTAATDYLSRLLSLDPWREDTHRHLMRLLAQSGQHDAALTQYQHLCRTLQSELGLAPSAESVALHDLLVAQKLEGHGDVGLEPVESVETPKAHNLPLRTSTFVPRDETADVVRLLDRPDCRLLTLVGSGGAGKTRLAIEVAEDAAARFEHGAWFVSLAPLQDAAGIAASIASGLGLAPSDAADASETLLTFLRSRELLLVLDNFEHLLEGTPLLARIVEEAPGVRLLVTSTLRLNVQGEWTVPLGAMRLPGDGEAVVGEGEGSMERYSALRLFRQSALRANPGIRFGTDDVRIAAQICERVGAVPLAIELAAGWVRTLSLSEIDQEVARDLDFLTGPKDAPERHGSLRAVFDSSWKLLSAEEQDALRRSSVFRDGFARDAALEVLGASLAVLSALVDKFLLQRDDRGRYRRHVLVDGFVREQAAARPDELAELRERHGRHYFDLLVRHDRLLKGRRQDETLAAIDSDMENVRAAWAWAAEQRREDALDVVMSSLDDVYTLQGRFQEAESSFALAASSLCAHSLTWGRARVRQGKFSLLLGRYERAKALLGEGLSLFRQQGALEDVALAVQHLAVAFYHQGAYAEAEARLQESLDLYRELDDPNGVAHSLNNLGNIAEMQGAYDVARGHHREALALRREIGEHRLVAISLVNLGDAAYRAGDVDEARAFYQESVSLRRKIGDHGRIAGSLARLGDVALAGGDVAGAEALCREALRLSVERYALPWIAQALLGIGAVLARSDRADEAAGLLSVVVHHPASPHWYRERAEILFREVAATLPPQTVAAAEARGAAGDLLEVAEEVLARERRLRSIA